jgi:hypothetical protein
MRVRTKHLTGTAIRFDGMNIDEVAALAGEQFAGTWAGGVLIRHPDGEIVPVRDGWCVARWSGMGAVTVSSGEAWDVLAEEVPSAV